MAWYTCRQGLPDLAAGITALSATGWDFVVEPLTCISLRIYICTRSYTSPTFRHVSRPSLRHKFHSIQITTRIITRLSPACQPASLRWFCKHDSVQLVAKSFAQTSKTCACCTSQISHPRQVHQLSIPPLSCQSWPPHWSKTKPRWTSQRQSSCRRSIHLSYS